MDKPPRLYPAHWIHRLLVVGLLSTLLGLVACGPLPIQSSQSAPSGPPLASVQAAAASPLAQPSSIAGPPAQVVDDLKARVSQEFGIPATELQVQASEAVDWSDSCLGAAQAEEVCAQVMTPGYRIVLASRTEQFEFHTDRSGRAVRLVR